jgi:hypothetical protein
VVLQFNENGYLEPYEAIPTDMETAKKVFVWNEARKELWNNFEGFIREVQEVLASPFSVWLNGSFVSKKEVPNDIDAVVFVDYQLYDTHEKTLAKFKALTFRKNQKLDVYFVRVYPEKNERKKFEIFDRKEWLFLFSKTRKKQRKGFLELQF